VHGFLYKFPPQPISDVTINTLFLENFIKQIEIGRFELTLNHLESVNPKAALQFVNYMGHETE
jgi:hypothetical protein